MHYFKFSLSLIYHIFAQIHTLHISHSTILVFIAISLQFLSDSNYSVNCLGFVIHIIIYTAEISGHFPDRKG